MPRAGFVGIAVEIFVIAITAVGLFIISVVSEVGSEATAWAQPHGAAPTLVGLMPSRAAASASVRARLDRLARSLGLIPVAPSFGLADIVQRAEGLASTGRLDEAAALLDVALDEGTRAPLQVADPKALVQAAVTRATIGLARGEQERAAGLLARLVRYDPTFELLPREDTPRVRAAVAQVRQRIGPTPALERGDLGERCDEQTLLVARRLDAQTLEYTRYVGCRPAATIRAGDATDETTLVAALGGPAPAPAPVVVATRAAAAPAPTPTPTPVYRRAWFWGVTIGVVLAATGVGVWAATRGQATSDAMWNVTPHL